MQAAPNPSSAPSDLTGGDLAAYNDGYSTALSWTSAGAAFRFTSLRMEFFPAFARGWEDRRAEDAMDEQAS